MYYVGIWYYDKCTINWNITTRNIIPTATFGEHDTSDSYCQFTAP